MKLLIVRHGESEADILQVHEGRADYELTEKGHMQAQVLAKYIKEKYKAEKIYASSLKRAHQTAQHISDAIGVSIETEEMLMEFNNGLIAGLSFEEADRKYPYIPNLPIHESVYKQESKLEFRHRAETVLSKIISENKENATIVVVTHGGMINQLYHAFLKLPIQSGNVFCTGDTGIHEWVIADNQQRVVAANCMEHIGMKFR